MTEQTITQAEAATQQLEQAIRLFLSGEDYLSAITLAGAAELLLAYMRPPDVQSASVLEALVSAFQHRDGGRKESITRLNAVRDWLKHYKDGITLTFTPSLSAEFMITRALLNYMMAGFDLTPPMQRFTDECWPDQSTKLGVLEDVVRTTE